MKVVLGAGLWNLPHIVILDEPTNFLDRDSLGALATAIKAFQGEMIMIVLLHDIPPVNPLTTTYTLLTTTTTTLSPIAICLSRWFVHDQSQC